MANKLNIPHLGYGLGLRTPHYDYVLEHKPAVDWFEVISENYMDTDGKARRILERVRADYPIATHGVSLSIGTADPLNSSYLERLKNYIEWLEPAWVSDHLCWTGVAHKNTHDLLPVPYTEQALEHIVEHIGMVQDYLGRPLVLENPSTYLQFTNSSIPEHEFLAEMARRSGCGLLLDINNIYVSCYNHALDCKAYIDAIPMEHVVQFHLAGHTNKGNHIVDTHIGPIIDEVWALYQYTLPRADGVNIMVEWDDEIPEFPVLYSEIEKARELSESPNIPNDLPDFTSLSVTELAQSDDAFDDTQHALQHEILRDKSTRTDTPAWVRQERKDYSAEEQIMTYRSGYRIRLVNIVTGAYPVLQTLIGEDAMAELVERYVESTPSEFPNIDHYSEHFSAYMQAQDVDSVTKEIAQLESAMMRVMDMNETAPLAPEDIADLTPDALVGMALKGRAAMELHRFTHDVHRLYDQLVDGAAPEENADGAFYLAVVRHRDVLWRVPLEADEYRLLTAIFAHDNVGEALEHVAAEFDEAQLAALGANVQRWFAHWMESGLLAKAA